MTEENSPAEKSNSRIVLGDLTNRIGKRGISERERNKVKRICSSPRPCSEINSMKGNVISGLSKVSNENRNPNVSGYGSGYGVSKSSTYVSDDCDGVRMKGDSRFHGGNDEVKKFDLKGGNSVNELASVDVHMGGNCNQTECSKGDPNLADKEGGKVSKSILNESKCPDLGHSVGKIVVDLTTFSGGEIVSSETHDKEYDPNLLNFLRSKANQSINTKVRGELGDSYSADTSKTVSETGDDDGKKCDTGEVNMNSEDTRNGLDDHNADNFVLSQTGSIDCTVLPQSQESRVFGVERSAKSKEDECTNMTEGTNSIEACSCSFCTKGMTLIKKNFRLFLSLDSIITKNFMIDICLVSVMIVYLQQITM